MRHIVGLVTALGVAVLPITAHAQSPEQLIRKIFADPGFMFHKHGSSHHTATTATTATLPPDTPLVEVPMPHLRPGAPGPGTSGQTLAYQSEEPRIVAAPIAAAPLPHISPSDDAVVEATPPQLRGTGKPEPDVAIAPPVPREKPNTQVASLPPPEQPATKPSTEVAALPPAAPEAPTVAEGGAVCSLGLAELGVTATPLPPISEGACGMPDPVKIKSLESGKVKIDGDATVDCAVATKLARFVNETVEPQAQETLGGKVTALRILDAYTCRNRDGLATGKLSEHAHGNAIDIGAFQIDGKRWITVGDSGNSVEDNTFLVGVRQAACGPFTTVLGPGSDSYHASHLHLDLIQRRTAGPSHGLYCR